MRRVILFTFLVLTLLAPVHFAGASSPTKPVRGELSNGLNYIIHPTKNGSPGAELRLIVHAGSCVEEDDERGFAHFLEHMAFAGSTNFPEREMVEVMERFGIRYGLELNAYTTHEYTIFSISIPRARAHTLDTLLLVVHDWLSELSIRPEAIEKEKPIVFEEIRAWDEQDPFYYLKIGQGLHGQRMPLGTMEEVAAIKSESLRHFYEKWYRPELSTLLIVGDVDASEVEMLIEKRLGSLVGNSSSHPETPPFSYPSSARYACLCDELTTQHRIEYIIPYHEEPIEGIAGVYHRALKRMALEAWKERLFKIPGLNVSDDWYLSDCYHFVLSMTGERGEDVLQKITQATGALRSLLDGYTIGNEEMEALIEQSKSRNHLVRTNDPAKLVNFYEEEALYGSYPLFERKDVEKLHAMLNDTQPSDLSPYFEYYRHLLTDSTALIAHTAPEPIESEEELRLTLTRAIEKGLSEGYDNFTYEHADERDTTSLTPPAILLEPVPPFLESIETIKEYPKLGATELWLTNGIQVVLRPTTAQDSLVKMNVFCPGGQAAIPPEEEFMLESLAGYVELGLIEHAPREQLQRYMAHHGMAIALLPSTFWYEIASTAPNNKANELLRLVYEKMFHPEIPHQDMEEVRTELLQRVGTTPILSQMVARNPSYTLERKIIQAMGEELCLHTASSTEEIEALDIERMVQAHVDRFSRTDGMVILLTGNFNPEPIIQTISGLFGKLPYRERATVLQEIPNPMKMQKEIIVDSENPEERAKMSFVYVNQYQPSLPEHLKLKITHDLLRTRAIDKLRTEEGIVYSPYVFSHYRSIPSPQAYYIFETTLAPQNIDKAKSIIAEIIADLQSQPITKHELDQVKRTFLHNKAEALKDGHTTQWQSTLSTLLKTGETLADFARYEEILDTITPETLLEFHRNFFSGSNQLLFQLTPKSN